MDTLKSKLPTIEYDKYTFYKKEKSNKTTQNKLAKKEYLDEILDKNFLKKYFNQTKIKLNEKS